jgi:hypothetical protein
MLAGDRDFKEKNRENHIRFKQMFKRFEVYDIYYWDKSEVEDCDWKIFNPNKSSTFPKPDGKGCKVRIKMKNGDEGFAYFCKDKMIWASRNGIAYFWTCDRFHSPIYDEFVTHWKPIKGGGA